MRRASMIAAAVALLTLAQLFNWAQSASADDGTASPATSASKAGQDLDGDPLPAGAMARLGTKRFGAFRTPVAVSFLSDGKTLVVTTADGWVQHWDPLTGRLVREKKFSDLPIGGAPGPRPAVAPGAVQLTLALHSYEADEERRKGVHRLLLVSQFSGLGLAKVEVGSSEIDCMALAPDGTTIAYSGESVHVINSVSAKEIATRKLDAEQSADALAFSPDGKTLAIGIGGRQVQLWNWKTNEEPRRITIPAVAMKGAPAENSLLFSPDGAQLAVGFRTFDDPTGALLLNVADGTVAQAFAMPEVRYWNAYWLTFSRDGKFLAAPIDSNNPGGGIALWDVASGKLVQRLRGPGDSVMVAFSGDSQYLAAIGGKKICVWDLESGKMVAGDVVSHIEPPRLLRFSPDDRRLISAGDDGTLRVWNLADSHEQQVMEVAFNQSFSSVWIRAMDVSPDGKYVASSSLDDSARIWEADTGRELYRLPGHGRMGGNRALRFTPDSRQLVSWGDDMRVYLWDVATGKAVRDFRAQPDGVKLPAEGLIRNQGVRVAGLHLLGGSLSSDASSLVVVLERVHHFSVATGKELAQLNLDWQSAAVTAISPDNRYLVAGGWGQGHEFQDDDGQRYTTPAKTHPVRLYSVAENRQLTLSELPDGYPGPMAFSRDSQMVALAVNEDPHIELRKVPELSAAGRIDLPCSACSLEFSSSGKLLAASMADCTILVWDLEHFPEPDNGKP